MLSTSTRSLVMRSERRSLPTPNSTPRSSAPATETTRRACILNDTNCVAFGLPRHPWPGNPRRQLSVQTIESGVRPRHHHRRRARRPGMDIGNRNSVRFSTS